MAMPLAEEVYRQILIAGGHPYLQLGGLRSNVETEALEHILYTEGNHDQIEHVNQVVKLLREEFEALVVIRGESNTRRLSNVDPDKQQLRNRAYTEVVRRYRERAAKEGYRWVITAYPTPAVAQDAEMSLEEFEDFIFQTTFSDAEDPVAEWNKIHDEQQQLVDWLKGKELVTVTGPNVDLELSIAGRNFLNSDGKWNMPSGEVLTSPVEDSANGWIRFSYPAIRAGREVENVELKFEKGRVVEASAMKNQDFLHSMLETDKGARYLGEFAFGTNKRINRFIKNVLFDEKMHGTIHLALGMGFAAVGGKNESAIHWDFICDLREGGQVFVDGELFFDSGEFKI
jgi:aminopeptidase